MIDETGKYTSFEGLPVLAWEQPTLEQVTNAATAWDAAHRCVVVRMDDGCVVAMRLQQGLEEAERDLYDSPRRAVRATINEIRQQLDEAERRVFGRATA